jgi:hypothetical protein
MARSPRVAETVPVAVQEDHKVDWGDLN